jgi:integrase
VSTTRTLTDEVRAILLVRGKTGEREVVCNKGVERYLDELKSFRTQELGNAPPDQEYVFCHPSGKPVWSFKGGFQRVLREAGVLYASDGKKRVPYSLRHTYATMRLSEGVSVFQLAANMGTSVEMLEDFYGKKRMRDPKSATENCIIHLRMRPKAVTWLDHGPEKGTDELLTCPGRSTYSGRIIRPKVGFWSSWQEV